MQTLLLLVVVFVHAISVASALLSEASVEQTQSLLKLWGLHDFFGAKVRRLSALSTCACLPKKIK